MVWEDGKTVSLSSLVGRLGTTRIEELKHAKLRVHKSMDIVILRREKASMNQQQTKSVLEGIEKTGPGIVKDDQNVTS